ncbi:unnamed protein product, partial [Leptidea sinapis]
MWIMYTFSFKSPESLDERYKYYGKVLWSILGHIALPLIMFYRFHSSVCFSDIWDAAYKPGSVVLFVYITYQKNNLNKTFVSMVAILKITI